MHIHGHKEYWGLGFKLGGSATHLQKFSLLEILPNFGRFILNHKVRYQTRYEDRLQRQHQKQRKGTFMHLIFRDIAAEDISSTTKIKFQPSWYGKLFRITVHLGGNQSVTVGLLSQSASDIFFVHSLTKLLNVSLNYEATGNIQAISWDWIP